MTTRQVLRFGGVRALLISNGVLFTGVSLQAAALGLQAYGISGRAADLGWIGLCEFLPAALLVLVTGTVADRFDRKRVAIIAIGGEVVCGIALTWYATTDPTEVRPLFVIAFAYGISRAFLAPATRPMPPMVAPDGAIPQVIAMYSATWTGATILGPALSGLLFAWSPAVAYFGATVLVVIAAVKIGRLEFLRQPERPDPDDKPTFRSAIEGLLFVRRTPILFAAIGLDLFAVLFGGAVALLPAIATTRLGVGDVAYGFLRAAPGIGAAAMAVFLAFKPLHNRIGRGLLLAVFVFGISTVVLGLTHDYWLAFVALMILAGADMVSVYIRGSLVPLVTPDEKRGRVMAVENVFIGASNELGAFESGLVAQAIGTPATVIGGGVATIAVVVIWWIAFPQLRNVDRFDELGH
ncbi:MAG TPA: MFS transporter [Ilumatobacteraceae bacterium]|nr:MFS transporter [Ilumatobacteraceae bacterium]HRB01952.1 MFS transporter [Ilumatobacteraceae bacterium]